MGDFCGWKKKLTSMCSSYSETVNCTKPLINLYSYFLNENLCTGPRSIVVRAVCSLMLLLSHRSNPQWFFNILAILSLRIKGRLHQYIQANKYCICFSNSQIFTPTT